MELEGWRIVSQVNELSLRWETDMFTKKPITTDWLTVSSYVLVMPTMLNKLVSL
jgi:hypothetical protein